MSASQLSLERTKAKLRKRYAEDEEYRNKIKERSRQWQLAHRKPKRDRTLNKTYDMKAYYLAYRPIQNAKNRERYRKKRIKNIIPRLLYSIMLRNLQ